MTAMKMIRTRKAMRVIADETRKKGITIGFVPTMGYLHEGHLSLVRRAKQENDLVVVSIFVNPAQFGPGEDYDRYPRDLGRDRKMLNGLADYIFAPETAEIYGENEKISFKIRDLTGCLCGVARPHHFPGVMLVLAKLLNLIKPHRVYLGQKDYQQTVAVKQLVDELFFNAEVVICPTVRERDGLAMSSRNKYLTAAERKEARVLSESLRSAEEMLIRGERNPGRIIREMERILQRGKFARIDYIDVREARTLKKVKNIGGEPVLVALAVNLGKTRLIDNIIFNPESIAEK